MRIKEERKRVFWRVLSDAAFDGVNLGMLGAMVGTSFLTQSAPVLMLAAGGYVSALLADLSRGDSWRRAATALRAQPPPLPGASEFDSPVTRELLSRLERARAQRTLVSRRPELGRHPRQRELAEQAAGLEGAVLRGLVALDRFTGYLTEQNACLLRKEGARLEELARGAMKPETRADYKAALGLLASRQRSIADVQERRDAIQAKLEAMVGLLEVLPIELMKLDAFETSSSVLDEDTADVRLVEEIELMGNAARALAVSDVGQELEDSVWSPSSEKRS